MKKDRITLIEMETDSNLIAYVSNLLAIRESQTHDRRICTMTMEFSRLLSSKDDESEIQHHLR